MLRTVLLSFDRHRKNDTLDFKQTLGKCQFDKFFPKQTSDSEFKDYFQTRLSEELYGKLKQWRQVKKQKRFLYLHKDAKNKNNDFIYIHYGYKKQEKEELFIFDLHDRTWLPQHNYDRELELTLWRMMECSKENANCTNPNLERGDLITSRTAEEEEQFRAQQLVEDLINLAHLVVLQETCVAVLDDDDNSNIGSIVCWDGSNYKNLYMIQTNTPEDTTNALELLNVWHYLDTLHLVPSILFLFRTPETISFKTPYYISVLDWLQEHPGETLPIKEAIDNFHKKGFIHGQLTFESMVVNDAKQILFVNLSQTMQSNDSFLDWNHLITHSKDVTEPRLLNVLKGKQILLSQAATRPIVFHDDKYFLTLQHQSIHHWLTHAFGSQVHSLVKGYYTKVVMHQEPRWEDVNWIIMTDSEVLKLYASEMDTTGLEYECEMQQEFAMVNMAPSVHHMKKWQHQNFHVFAFSMQKVIPVMHLLEEGTMNPKELFDKMKVYFRKLAKLKYAHFDAHIGNWALRQADASFVMIDFEYASIGQLQGKNFVPYKHHYLIDELKMMGDSLLTQLDVLAEPQQVMQEFKQFYLDLQVEFPTLPPWKSSHYSSALTLSDDYKKYNGTEYEELLQFRYEPPFDIDSYLSHRTSHQEQYMQYIVSKT